MIFAELIRRYGGKTASVLAQYNAGNVDILLPFSIVEVAKLDEGHRPSFRFTGRQIARGSANGDERGLVDVLKTIPKLSALNLNGEIDLADGDDWSPEYINTMRKGDESREETVRRLLLEKFSDPLDSIVSASRKQSVMDYANWEGLDSYGGVNSILIQQQNRENGSGNVIEHPNIEGHYLINFVYHLGGEDFQFSQYLADANGNIATKTQVDDLSPNEIKAIVEMKKRTRAVEFIADTHSSQVEFGLLGGNQAHQSKGHEFATSPSSSVLFYQERQFIQFDFDESIDPKLYHFNRFGHLRDPMDIRVLKIGEVQDAELTDGVPSAYVINSRHIRPGLEISFRPDNMDVYVVPMLGGTAGGYTLEHNNYRWAQKARLTFMDHILDGNFLFDNYEHGSVIHIDPQDLKPISVSMDKF